MNRAAGTGAAALVIAAAALIGLYGRFQGIGTWPLGVDEFYISRSIDHILSGGLPRFPCGGYYTRGLLFQYLVAALRMAHLSPEFAGRFLAGLCSVAMLPAAYLLGRRMQGAQTGWLVVIVLLLSIWEIEMARFGRMYSPFQAVFCWYLVLYLRYTVDGKASALLGMIGLSFLGVLTWEGGTLLGVANIFAILQLNERGRLRSGDGRRLAVLVAVLALLFLASRDLRDLGTTAAVSASDEVPAAPAGSIGLFAALRIHWIWCIGFLAPLALACASARFINSFRVRWMACAGLWLVVLAALAHAFVAVAGLLAVMFLLDLVTWRELATRHSRYFAATLLAAWVFWLAYTLSTGGNPLAALLNFPDIFQRIARPWLRTMPLLTLAMLLGCAYWFRQSLAASKSISVTKVLLTLLFVLVLAVGSIPTNRIETRYTFFLYPLLVALSIAAIAKVMQGATLTQRASPWLTALLTLGVFVATEDFQIRQVAHIDSAAVNYRIGMSAARADHYYPRNDMRSVAQWLDAHVTPGDVVVSGIPNLDPYYPGIDYFYLEEDDNRYDAYVCADGRTERWTGHAVLEKIDGKIPALDSSHHLYATVYPEVQERLLLEAQRQGWSVIPVYTALDGKAQVVSISRSAPPGTL